MTDPAIVLDGLTKDYGPLRALDDVSVRVPRGRIGLLGPNGAGKSTLVKCLLGLVRPSAGRGEVLGIDIARRPLALRQRVGYLPEVDCHIPGMTAAELVAYAGELAGLPARAARSRAHEVLEYVGIGEERYRLVDGYSAGMRQKVKLAQALVHDPELVFLDEPTNGLDPQGRERMLALCRDLGERHGIGLVYSSHLLADVEEVCDEVVMLRAGRLLAQGRIEDLRRAQAGRYELRVQGEAPGLPAALAARGLEATAESPGRFAIRPRAPEGEAGEDARPAVEEDVAGLVLAAVRESGAHLRSLRPVRARLEDVFLQALAGATAPADAGEEAA